ncbi:ATP-dependent endonuclease [Mangrovimonas sp. YM274]|uniref:ATP-dependent nuclease n=1 Tax=Mangrovimonas sp. YM274 TaxID=3070660 RepID=UPI0027DBD243|nr:AAA family ATPase [Mangrovimonas sp. YM274]WMI70264.1 AAA family ATPase [Mangrovimonas sp. YM274]
MKLKRFEISGFRRVLDAEYLFGDATFLIGENNVGKSAVLKALELFHSGETRLSILDFFYDEESGYRSEKVVFTAEYVGLPEEAETWRGFKGRILKREIEGGEIERYILFKKEYTQDGKSLHSLKEYKRALKVEFEACKKAQDFIDSGLSLDELTAVFGDEIDLNKNITVKAHEGDLEELTSIWDYDYDSSEWFHRPGGIVGNIISKLPRFLFIPAEDRKDEIDGKSGALQKVMKSLFDDVRDTSENFAKAQEYLNKLAEELDPTDETKDFGKMLEEINLIVGNVFPETGLHVKTELDDADKILKPHFNIEMSSNIKTSPDRQGTGSIRSAAFALLRFRSTYLERKDRTDRNLIIGFEEPEIYLHPNAANSMRNEIYNLAVASTSQIICTTHSPYMIDLGKDLDKDKYPKQVLNLLKISLNEKFGLFASNSNPFNTTQAYNDLIAEEQDQIKFILKIDDYIARVFFVKHLIIVEGDTEDVVFRETIRRLPLPVKKVVDADYQIIKARGKATIISLVKYLKALGFQPFVINDEDQVAGATKFNKPISDALGSEEDRLMLKYCMEDVLGYEPPSGNKPYQAYSFIKDNWDIEEGWDGVGKDWKEIIENNVLKEIFESYVDIKTESEA